MPARRWSGWSRSWNLPAPTPSRRRSRNTRRCPAATSRPANIIRGLRLINDVDWPSWFEAVSRVDDLLRQRGDYAALDFQSRDQYRAEIEDLARRSKLSEYDVTQRATELASRAAKLVAEGAVPVRSADVGAYLIGDLRPELERDIGASPGIGRTIRRVFRRTDWVGIVVPVFLLTALLMAFTGSALAALGLTPAAIALMLVFFALPASEGALGIFTTFALLALKPTRSSATSSRRACRRTHGRSWWCPR